MYIYIYIKYIDKYIFIQIYIFIYIKYLQLNKYMHIYIYIPYRTPLNISVPKPGPSHSVGTEVSESVSSGWPGGVGVVLPRREDDSSFKPSIFRR